MSEVVISELTTELENAAYGGLNTSGVQALINSLTSAGAAQIDVDFLTSANMQAAVVATEYASLDALRRDLWLTIMVSAADEGVNIRTQSMKDQILAVWASGTTTRNQIAALQRRVGSRAEVLWLDGAVVTRQHILEARA